MACNYAYGASYKYPGPSKWFLHALGVWTSQGSQNNGTIDPLFGDTGRRSTYSWCPGRQPNPEGPDTSLLRNQVLQTTIWSLNPNSVIVEYPDPLGGGTQIFQKPLSRESTPNPI